MILPIQRSTPAEGSVGGVGGRIHDYLEAAGHGDDQQGSVFRPIRNNCTGRIDETLSLTAGIVAQSVMLRKLVAYHEPEDVFAGRTAVPRFGSRRY